MGQSSGPGRICRRGAWALAACALLTLPLRAGAADHRHDRDCPRRGSISPALREAQDRVFRGHDGHIGPAGADDLAQYQRAEQEEFGRGGWQGGWQTPGRRVPVLSLAPAWTRR